MNSNDSRNYTIDILRIIGLLLVISAHCGFPSTYFEVREFDVAMLMFVAGASFAITYKKNDQNYWDYVIKRFKKLILSVWLFLTCYFIFFGLCLGEKFTIETILKSYSLLSGIGFVWIFRVMFSTALLNPLLYKATDRLKIYQSFLFSIGIILLNDLVYYLCILKIGNETIQDILRTLVTYTISYGAISLLGILWMKMNRKQRVISTLSFLAIFLSCGYFIQFPSLQNFKYPPMLYYISYGILWSDFLYLAFEKLTMKAWLSNIILWLSRHTMSIYLCHIVIMAILNRFALNLSYIEYYFIVVSLSILLEWLIAKTRMIFKKT